MEPAPNTERKTGQRRPASSYRAARKLELRRITSELPRAARRQARVLAGLQRQHEANALAGQHAARKQREAEARGVKFEPPPKELLEKHLRRMKRQNDRLQKRENKHQSYIARRRGVQ